MENQNAFNEEEYSALRAETCTRIEIMNSQATSALTTALATWVMGFTLLGFQVTSQPTDIMAVLLPLGQIVAFLATIKERRKSSANGVARSIYSCFL